MGARKHKTMAKANFLIAFGYKPTYRQLMISYRFWKAVMKGKKNMYQRVYGKYKV